LVNTLTSENVAEKYPYQNRMLLKFFDVWEGKPSSSSFTCSLMVRIDTSFVSECMYEI